jgi:hypothetical protein
LPIAVPCALFVASRLGMLAYPEGRSADRAVAGCVLGATFVITSVRLLGAVHAVTGPAVLAVLVLGAVAVAALGRRGPPGIPLAELATRASAPLLVVAAGSMFAAIIAARWLPVWQWDALGYHLPYVNFVLVARGFDAVPDDMPYVSTYPHNVEILMIALRALLPDDRLVDVAQIPCALFGAIATAGIARRVGASPPAAMAAGAAWVVVPAVFLQMPTDYVDVACAAFFLSASYFAMAAWSADSPRDLRKALVLGALALGLYLGTKPNAPLSGAILALCFFVAGIRGRAYGVLALVAALLVAGSETFIVNAIHHGNPVWPVRVQLGPIVLPGTESMQRLLESGAAAPHLRGSMPWRILRSWTSLTSPPVFDMRIGGFGPLVLTAIPAALITLVTQPHGKRAAAWGAVAASVVAPDPAVARYVMAFPALCLALAAPRISAVPARLRPWLGALVGAIGVVQVAYAWPGLIGEGPPLGAYASMTDDERARAVGANGLPGPFMDLRKRVGPGETFAFDQSLDLPYLAWESDLRYRAIWIPASLRSSQVEDFIEREHIRVLAVDEGSPTGAWLQANPDRFPKVFQCKGAPCSVFARR